MRPRVPPPLVTHGRARLNETWRLIDAPKGRTTCQVRWAALAHVVQLSADKRAPGRSQMLMLHWQAAVRVSVPGSTPQSHACSVHIAEQLPVRLNQPLARNSGKPLRKPDRMQGLACGLLVSVPII